MGLKIKNFQDVLKSMVDWIIQNSTTLVDFSAGSAIRTLLENVADEIEEIYFKMWQNFNYSIENSIYNSFDFPRKAAVSSYGYETINFTNPLPGDVLIPAGTEFGTDPSNMNIGAQTLYFQTKINYTVKKGSTSAQVQVFCETPGTVGNVAANSIIIMVNQIPYASTVTNDVRFNTGIDQESLSDRKSRFAKFVSTRAKGTVAALQYGALEVPQITGVYVDDSTHPGMIYLYCHDAAGNLDDDLKKAVVDNELNYRAAGIPLFVNPIVKDSVDVDITITVIPQNNTSDYNAYLVQQIQAFFDKFSAGQGYSESDFNLYIRQLDQISITDVTVNNPSDDFDVEPSQLIRSGNVTVHLVSDTGS